MKTKTAVQVKPREKITDTTLSKIGMDISGFLDIIFENPMDSEKFRQIYKQTPSECSLHAANDEMSIHFSVEWHEKKGGAK